VGRERWGGRGGEGEVGGLRRWVGCGGGWVGEVGWGGCQVWDRSGEPDFEGGLTTMRLSELHGGGPGQR
jgi:hypothetical protein